jgi:hypothetical protein
MANMLADAATWFAEQLQGNLATTITYQGGGTDLTISATRGASGHQVDTITGVISWHDQDWLIPVSVLTREPASGHKIVYGTEIYEVLASTGEQPWRWSDNHKTIYRIHTKRIKA